MTELGERLKLAREEKGLSYDELQERTKIQKRYLQAIEQGNYQILPGSFYVRAFVKNYAEAVGLDPEQFLEEYNHELPGKEEPEEVEFTPRSSRIKDAKRDNTKLYSFIPKFLTAVVLVGLVLVVWFVFQNYAGTDKQDTPSAEDIEKDVGQGLPEVTEEDQQSGDTSKNDEKQGEDKEEDTAVDVPKQSLVKVEQKGNDTFVYELKGASEFKVDITFTGDCYVDLKDENKKLIDMKSNKGQNTVSYDLSKYKEVTFNVGFSPNFQMKINGEPFVFEVKPEDLIHRYIVIKYVPSQASGS